MRSPKSEVRKPKSDGSAVETWEEKLCSARGELVRAGKRVATAKAAEDAAAYFSAKQCERAAEEVVKTVERRLKLERYRREQLDGVSGK
jgi:hypothetical protein